MRVEQVRAFVVLAEELNFRRAAARLFVSQPTLTAQLHQLEHHLGVALFHRGPHGTRLTDAGEQLMPVARDVLRSVDDLLEGAVPLRDGVATRGPSRRRVRIGVGPGGIGPATWPALQELVRRTDLEPRVVSLSFSTALPAVDRGDVDAVLLHGPVEEVGCRQVTTVGHVPVVVLVPTHHWLAASDFVAVDTVVPLLRAVPPPEMGRAFTDFWLCTDHPLSSRVGLLRLHHEEPGALVTEAARSGLVGLWPRDVEPPAGSGVVVRPLATERLAPLQVVTRVGWAPADDLLAAARAAVRATLSASDRQT